MHVGVSNFLYVTDSAGRPIYKEMHVGRRVCSAMESIPNDMLELILLHVDSQVSLLRAAATCKRWRRIVTDEVFLSRFGSLHKLPVLAGCYSYQGSVVRSLQFEPSPCNTDVDSGCFSLDFLHDHSSKRIMDSKGSLLLFRVTGGFIVCEPLTRRHEVISLPAFPIDRCRNPHAFLLGCSGGDDGAKPVVGSSPCMSNFSVLCWFIDYDRDYPFVFNTGGSWRAITINRHEWHHFIGFASRSLYWLVRDGTVLTLDDQAGTEYAPFLLPDPDVEAFCPFDPMSSFQIAVADGGDGEPRIVLGNNGENTAGILKVFARLRAAGGEWALEKSIQLTAVVMDLPLLEEGGWCFVERGRGVHSAGTVRVAIYTRGGCRKFSIQMDKMEVESLQLDMYTNWTYPINFPWPPSLHACTYRA
ncbi:unnamed protein product [Urochloa decumbens]|uniref:F-box domain-containing protein n=1 Tax=Urochloa decumbens TaxID=240449 RepID=A0ABC9FSJ6_9POAL